MVENVDWFENFDLENIITPVKADNLDQLLRAANYNAKKRDFLVQGFKEGFSLGFKAKPNTKQTAQNLRLRIGSKTELWNKLLKEVQLKRVAGPFEDIPFENYI